MNPVIGLDVSKGESHAQAFIDRGLPHGKSFRFEHNLEGLASFLNYVQALEAIAEKRPAIVLEATGHYHSPVIQFLEPVKLLTPILINWSKCS
jgi:transposase